MLKRFVGKGSIILTSAILVFSLAACGDQGAEGNSDVNAQSASEEENTKTGAKLSGEIKIDGSSTVFPISQAVAEEFMNEHNEVNVTVGLSGSSNGLKKLISGEIDIADASRQIKDKEVEELQAKNQEAVEMPVAFDGITVVIHPENDWAKEMTVAELKKIWEKGSTVKKWSDVRDGWPNEEIILYGPGTASGTFEYFTKEINGEEKVSRDDYTPSEDDNVLVTGVSGDKYAMGYFGFSYFEENRDKLAAISIKADDNSPAVAPTRQTIEDGSYKPLSRKIYIYPMKSILEKPEVKEFIKFYMSDTGKQLIEEVGYVKLPQSFYDENLKHVQ